MKNKKIIIGLLIGIFVLLAINTFSSGSSGIKNKWQGIYYPDGCLGCENSWIFSPFFETVNECIDWVNNKKNERGDSPDVAECAFNCKQNCEYGSCMLECKETVDVLGKASL